MEDRITLTEAIARLADYGPAVWLGVLAALATFAIEVVLCTKGILFADEDWKRKRAQKEGKFALGTRTGLRYRDREPEGRTANRRYIATYEYTVNGVTRTKQIALTGRKPPRTLYFYYTKDPSRVFSEFDEGKNPLKVLLYIFPVLVAFVVATLLGFQP